MKPSKKSIWHKLTHVKYLSLALLITGCTSSYDPFVGVTRGKNKSYYSPVEALVYNYEGMLGGSVNGGCIPRTSAIESYDVGKKRYGGGATCGGFSLPAKWKPGMTVKVNWEISPYPDWRSKILNVPGLVRDPEHAKAIASYKEYYTAEVPLPPPPPHAGDDFGKVVNVTVHFLACNQLYITYGTKEENHANDTATHFALFDKSQKLCKPRPIVKSMADYHKNKAKMDAARAERKNIPQVILPEFIEQLTTEGKLPVPSK